jgi:hypothetical protein
MIGNMTFAPAVLLSLVFTGLPSPMAPATGNASSAAAVQSAAGPESRIRVYYEDLSEAMAARPDRVSLADLLQRVMRLAREQADDDPVEANRAALLALAFHVNRWDPRLLTADAQDWSQTRGVRVVLAGRHDLARHFALSAFIAAVAGAPAAELAGTLKELRDTRLGSGFSFSDLAADRAGTRLGQAAAASPDAARQLQTRASGDLEEQDLMPILDGLPDHLSEAEFARRFTGRASPAYDRIVADIDRRVDALDLFRR